MKNHKLCKVTSFTTYDFSLKFFLLFLSLKKYGQKSIELKRAAGSYNIESSLCPPKYLQLLNQPENDNRTYL